MVDKATERKKKGLNSVVSRSDIASIGDFLNQVINDAILRKASDIHIDPKADSVIVRIRSVGSMEQLEVLSKELHDELIGRIKILSRLRTDIHDRSQDGRFAFDIQDGSEKADVRVSVLPTFFGENAVLRLLRPEAKREHDYALLGMFPEQGKEVSKALLSRQGMIVVAGPTGSGKTTTIYALLQELVKESKNIITIEDPIEYVTEEIRQIQVSESGGFTFPKALRAVVRQDPDVVVIGEMRDRETAELAFQAAQTGHLVITSLHAEDAANVYSRLIDLGVSERALHSLCLIISQRLIAQPSKKGEQAKERLGIFEVIPVRGDFKAALFGAEFPEDARIMLHELGACLLGDSYVRKLKERLIISGDYSPYSHE